ncbi:MAG: hypothetical protein KF901_17535 [Myxococcales bacterium]|nr:hypothetical protein [Myxococcales bacterium]
MPLAAPARRPTILYVDAHDAARACLWQALPAARVIAVKSLETASRVVFGGPPDEPSGVDLVLLRAATCGDRAFRWPRQLASHGFQGTCALVLDADGGLAERAKAMDAEAFPFPLLGFALRGFVYGRLGLPHDGATNGGYDPAQPAEERRGSSQRPRVDADDEDVLLLALGHRALTPEDVRLVAFASRTTTQRELADLLGLAHESVKSAAKRVQLKTGQNIHAFAHGLAREARRRARDEVARLLARAGSAAEASGERAVPTVGTPRTSTRRPRTERRREPAATR